MDIYKQLSLDIGLNTDDAMADRQTDQNLSEKIKFSIKVLKLAKELSKNYYDAPLIITYSGGKDSDVLLHLAEACLDSSEFEVCNSHTTVDAPETVRHIREVFKRLNEKGVKTTIDYHKKADGTNITMWNLIPQRGMPPTRLARYCCSVLKETSTPNRIACLGVRAEESNSRKNRDIFGIRGENYDAARFFSYAHTEEVYCESNEIQDDNWDCVFIQTMKKRNDTVVNPIYYWTEKDVWDYVNENNIEMNPLYSRGYTRVGCIGCPMATYRLKMKEFADYPYYKKAYMQAFDRMLKKREKEGKENNWKNAQEVFDWWIEKDKHIVPGQIEIFEK